MPAARTLRRRFRRRQAHVVHQSVDPVGQDIDQRLYRRLVAKIGAIEFLDVIEVLGQIDAQNLGPLPGQKLRRLQADPRR